MLKRIYIDNFRCFVNFELSVDSINLFLGPNGAGKSTVFDVLRKIQAFIQGEGQVANIFHHDDLTRWQTSLIQTFELEIKGNSGTYKYELAIEHDEQKRFAQVAYERLWLNDKPVLKFEKENVQLYLENHSEDRSYPFNRSQSVIPSIPSTPNAHLNQFKTCIDRFIIVKINPATIALQSNQEESKLSVGAENFVSWYRYVSQNQGKTIKITSALQEIFNGFDYFSFIEAGKQSRYLTLRFSDNGNVVEYGFNELSDGQRVLIALYSLVYYAQSEGYTLCIDEPENFLALPEIQPWLTLVYDFCDARELQVLLISHHPELIDYLASSAGRWFDYQGNTPVRVKQITENIEGGVPISELIARGWLHG